MLESTYGVNPWTIGRDNNDNADGDSSIRGLGTLIWAESLARAACGLERHSPRVRSIEWKRQNAKTEDALVLNNYAKILAVLGRSSEAIELSGYCSEAIFKKGTS